LRCFKGKDDGMQEDTGMMRPLTPQQVIWETEVGNEDLIFHVGEKLQVKGGDFRVKSFGRRMMVIEGLPGTRMIHGKDDG